MSDYIRRILRESLLGESSLNRVYQHMLSHDTAALTAFRDESINCLDNSSTEPNNNLRNKELKATLLRLGYGVTAVDGSYIENFNTKAAKEVKENSFFIVNLNDGSDFFSNIEKLGQLYCQDSVLLIPKGGINAKLLGTNNGEFPSLGQTINVGRFKPAQESEFMSRVGGKPFNFGEELETFNNHSKNSKWAISKLSENVIKKIG